MTRTKTIYLGKFWVHLKNLKNSRKLTVRVFIYNRPNAQSNGCLLGRANGEIVQIFSRISCFSDFLCLYAIQSAIYETIFLKNSSNLKKVFASLESETNREFLAQIL